MFIQPPMRRVIEVQQTLPGEAFYSLPAGDKPEWNGRRIYFDSSDQDIQNNPVLWFTGMAGQAGTPNDILEYFNQPGGQTVPPYGVLFYNKQPAISGTIPADGIEYPSVNTIPLTITLVDTKNTVLVQDMPYSWNLSRLIFFADANQRKGFDLMYNLKNIDLRKSYLTITGNGIPMQISGVDTVEFQPVYYGPFYLKLLFLI